MITLFKNKRADCDVSYHWPVTCKGSIANNKRNDLYERWITQGKKSLLKIKILLFSIEQIPKFEFAF